MKSTLLITFRGKKLEVPFEHDVQMSVGDAKSIVAASSKKSTNPIQAQGVKIIFKGKLLKDDEADLCDMLLSGKSRKATYHLVAMGVSTEESRAFEKEFHEGVRKSATIVRDDLSERGRQMSKERQLVGVKMMNQAAQKSGGGGSHQSCGFGRIDTLSNLPDEAKAREILSSLANDPGIKACMAKHRWKVGSLAELYPKGKVGVSEVCVMGLNKNKGQQILLRLRTDDLKGFRKILSIREVLYHELAHNVHSDHDSEFFKLMRKIKRECLQLDWTEGNGTTPWFPSNTTDVVGGTHRLGGIQHGSSLSAQALAGRAALIRLSAEEAEIEKNCGCGKQFSLYAPNGKANNSCKRSPGDEH